MFFVLNMAVQSGRRDLETRSNWHLQKERGEGRKERSSRECVLCTWTMFQCCKVGGDK